MEIYSLNGWPVAASNSKTAPSVYQSSIPIQRTFDLCRIVNVCGKLRYCPGQAINPEPL